MNLTSFEKGELSVARKILLRHLERKFGAISESVLERVRRLSTNQIEERIDAIVDGQSLEEMGLLDADAE